MTDPTPPVTPHWTPPPPQYGYGYAAAKPTNGLAIAAMVVSIVALPAACFSYGVASLVIGAVGAILGHVSRKQIRQQDQQGEGLALAGIIIGWIAVGLSVLFLAAVVIFVVWLGSVDPSTWEQSMLMGWLH